MEGSKNWTNIDKGFEYYQQYWKKANITYEEAKEWIEIGFRPYDYKQVNQWKYHSFTPHQAKEWIEIGLSEYEYDLAAYLRAKNIQPSKCLDIKKLKEEGISAQEYLDIFYPKDQRKTIKKLDISEKNLTGTLDLTDFTSLEELNCPYNKLTSLNLANCLQLKGINCSDNNLTQDLVSFSHLVNLEGLIIGNNLITGSLDCLSNMKKLKVLNITNTDITEVNIDKLSRSLEKIDCLTTKDCKSKTIAPLLETVRWGWCKKCQQPNTSREWCQACAEQEWKQLKGQELVKKFIEQQQLREDKKESWETRNQLKWIPYEQFINIAPLAKGGFSQIYKAQWGKECDRDRYVVLKILTNSKDITLEFLTEIANTKLVDSYDYGIVPCCGISQDPITKNYIMIMDYKKEGNLRQYLENKSSGLSLEDKIEKLRNVVDGLKEIHQQNLVHQDLHSGNVLNNLRSTFITDLGLSKPVNYQKQEGQIFGVLPYVAPEVLQGQPYTKASDIYGFGIIAYELLANSYPYPILNETDLVIKICNGYRPEIESPRLPIPQVCKDFIKRCWTNDPTKRPDAEELGKVTYDWYEEINKKKTPLSTSNI
ncbi:protein kinase [endosymbiont GvMRE of Glomus versiforme]|uniref:protein kinase n=1 Tax=endosymbiont GvMRE of Glomus versiforme TaxID=2039283 RepID=UPI000EE09A52|nr:protein kinase [endosymbiont GvMRE of Glomus versiforme]RHZ35678.1 Cdc15p [endosymbiont GvMRE of Glomus versiforme]